MDLDAMISVIIPARNASAFLRLNLAALSSVKSDFLECILVSDGSTDETASVAVEYGTRFLETGGPFGAAYARNLGALNAKGNLLIFLDADVCVRPDTISRIATLFRSDRQLDALFGSYDDAPAVTGTVSQFRNLLHCYVHHRSHRQASSFWAGCGAIRKDVFFAHHGFDEFYDVPSIEDIELGLRMARTGAHIVSVPEIQVKHLKQWTFMKMVSTDIFQRGVPWARLILASRRMPNDLNVNVDSRISVALAVIVLLSVLLTAAFLATNHSSTGVVLLASMLLLLISASALVAINFNFYRFLQKRRGLWFATKSIFLHGVYFLCCASAMMIAIGAHLRSSIRRSSTKAARPEAHLIDAHMARWKIDGNSLPAQTHQD